MSIEELKKLTDRLYKSFPAESMVDFDLANDEVLVRIENPINAKTLRLNINNLIEEFEDETEENKEDEIVWDGISAVRAWEGGGKKRIYFRCVGVPENAHARGKVFLELVRGSWIPNMKYQIMRDFANQLNMLEIDNPYKVQEKYEEFLQNC